MFNMATKKPIILPEDKVIVTDEEVILPIQKDFKSFEDFHAFEELIKDSKKFAKQNKLVWKVSNEQGEKFSKYKNSKLKINGVVYDSKSEVFRHEELLSLEKDGLISNLRFHDKNDVYVIQDYPAITYIPDFCYSCDGFEIIEDVKGLQTSDFILKKKIMINKILNSDIPYKLILTRKTKNGYKVTEEYSKGFLSKKFRRIKAK